MSKFRNRFLACMMSVAMMVSMLSVPSYATELETEAVTETVVAEETDAVVVEAEEAVEITEAVENTETVETAKEDISTKPASKETVATKVETKEEPEFGKEVLGYAVPLTNANRLRSGASTLSASTLSTTECPTPAQAQSIMYSLKSQYPEGMHYTNDDYYDWKGGIFWRGYGCAGFAFLLSDAAFGDLPARQIYNVNIGMLHSGDILRVNNDSHSVMVMEVYSDHIVLAEGNYNSSIHWGRIMTAAEVFEKTDYMLTRYPVGNFGEAFTIHYNLNGAAGSIPDQQADKGIATSTTSEKPERFGYEFKGWSTSKTATSAQYKAGDFITITADTTLYAVWEKAAYPKLSDDGITTKTVSLSKPYEKAIFEFVPAKSTDYTFESTGTIDTILKLYSDSFEMVGESDDDGEGNNFRLKQSLTAGQTYYIEVSIFGGYTGSFTFTVTREGANPEPTDPEPIDPDMPIPVIGSEFPVQVDVNIEEAGQISYVKIVPDKTAKYTFESTGDFDPCIKIYDENENFVDADDDAGDDLNFQLSTILEAGKTYYAYAFLWNGVTGSFSYYVTRDDQNPVIPSGTSSSAEMKFDAGEVCQYYFFTPAATGTYKFELFGVTDEEVFVTDGASVEEDIDCGDCHCYNANNKSTIIAVDLEAGVRYRVYVYRYENKESGKTYKLNVTAHTHSKAIRVPAVAATWTKEGKTEGWLCDCGHTMVSVKTVPKKTVAKPVLSSATMTTSGVSVKWNAVSGTEAYRVFYKESGGSWTKVADTTATSYTVPSSKLTSGKTYYFTVRCITKDGKTYISSFDTTGKSVVFLSPIKPTVANASTGISVKWTKVAGATGYYIYRKTGSGSFSKIKTITSNSTVSYTDTAIASKNGTGYTYAVRAYKGSTVGAYTAVSTIRLSSVSMSSLSNSATCKMTAKWTKNAKAAGYQIQYSTSSTFASGNKTVTVSGYSTLSKTIGSLTKGKTYYVRVRAYKKNSAGTTFYSAWSGKKSVKISK